MKLRPHHLLCTQGYGGKGYSSDFVKNMTAVTSRLRREADTEVDIVFSTDDICAKCPKILGTDLCRDQCKVKALDQKVTDYFGLEEKRYLYQRLIREIDAKMTEAMLEDICATCSWYPVSACKRRILGADRL